MDHLPTDEEYLNELYERFKDDEWIAFQEEFTRVDDLIAAARKAIVEGVFKNDELDRAIEVLRETGTPSQFFRGQFINTLRAVALKMLEPYQQRLENIPVGCLPIRALNAGAYRTPRGGAVILLDQGVIFQLAMLVRAYIAYYTWHTPDPYCRDQMQEFEADEFAFKNFAAGGMQATDVAFSCGLLLNFFHLCELISPPRIPTHPPALSRWEKIKNLAPLSRYPESWANYLDATFATLLVSVPKKGNL